MSLTQRGRAEGWLPGTHDAEVHTEVETVADRDTPMRLLASRLALDAAQLDVLWLLAAIELSPALARLSQGFTVTGCAGLSIQLLHELAPISSDRLRDLERLVLVELVRDPSVPIHQRTVRANDRVIELAAGEVLLDHEVARVGQLHLDPVGHPVDNSTRSTVVIATGPDGSGRATTLGRFAGRTLRVRMSDLVRQPAPGRLLRGAAREAALFDATLMLEDVVDGQLIEDELSTYRKPLLVTAREPVRFSSRRVIVHAMTRPDTAERAVIWRDALPEASDEAIAVASAYALFPGDIVASARNAATPSIEAIRDGVRTHLGEQLAGVATRVEVRQTWNDIVLQHDQATQLVELVARVRHRAGVLEAWGFGDKIGRGHGIAALFSGPPGTGKTMAAGLVAKELGLDLYQVDLSKIVSKYIGETEKQLARVFDVAETGHVIVLFDEADSLFAKRSEVRSSNDRYANLEVNYLLQRLEAFTGIAILTSNHESAIDEAFRRRLSLHVRFPAPDEAERALLWNAVIPEAAPVADDIDMNRLARRFVMTGGHIRNAALRAAYLARHEGTAITGRLLERAAQLEYEALGKIA